MLTRMVATPWVKEPWPASRNHGFNSPPMPKPVAVPVTAIRSPSREPVIVMDGFASAAGVTAFDGTDDADHPAPVNALTVKVYAVPFVKPVIVHDVVPVRHVCPPGAADAW